MKWNDLTGEQKAQARKARGLIREARGILDELVDSIQECDLRDGEEVGPLEEALDAIEQIEGDLDIYTEFGRK